MATISRTGITGGSTIQPTHVTNIIDALDGTSTTTTVVATGSFTGSLVGALTGTASFATTALSASYASNVPVTASYALSALSSSYAVTASYALNAGGGTGVGFPFTGSAQVTGSMGITGSLNVTAGVTASLQGTSSFAVSSSRAVTASFADTSDQLLVQRTVTEASFYPVIADSANAQPTAERLKSTTGITINPGTNVIAGATLSGSVGLSGSFTVQSKFDTVDLSFIAGGNGSGTGQFILPKSQTIASPPAAGSTYWDDAGGRLYIYSATNAAWYSIALNP
jgi:hypothetical protein